MDNFCTTEERKTAHKTADLLRQISYGNSFQKITNLVFKALLVLPTIFLQLSCKSNVDNVPGKPVTKIFSSKNWKAEINFPEMEKCSIVRLENGNLHAFLPADYGLLKSISTDNGLTWTQPELILNSHKKVFPIILSRCLIGVVSMETITNGGQIFFYPFANNKWAAPSAIRDTRWGKFNIPRFARTATGLLYCTWTDWRNGNSDVFFSSSFDHGTRWSENTRINNDAGGQEQNVAGIFSSPDGTLYIMWEDNRNSKTLFDIYCSYSTDGGNNWNTAFKVNDDSTNTWQISPSFTVDAQGYLCTAWMDSRDTLASGEHTSNIYFSFSFDRGKSWSRNTRISSSRRGSNLYPRLVSTGNGNLYCWWLCTEDNLLGDILLSYSTNGGRAWSEPIRINDDLERAHHYIGSLIQPYKQGDEFLFWNLDWRNNKADVYLSKLLSSPDAERKERTASTAATSGNPGLFLHPLKLTTLLCNDFSKSNFNLWNIYSGTWIIKDEMLIGFGAPETKIFSGSRFWSDYIFEGSFKLDSIDHRAAYLYVRVCKNNKNNLTYYRITNFFRQGVTLEYFDGKTLIPISSSAFPFRANRWYRFRTVIKAHVLNHTIDDSMLISTDEIRKNLNGKIGLGSFASPTYFKDVCITSIK